MVYKDQQQKNLHILTCTIESPLISKTVLDKVKRYQQRQYVQLPLNSTNLLHHYKKIQRKRVPQEFDK